MHTLWALVMLAALVATAVLLFGLVIVKGAPQEAAIAAIAVAIAVIPYVFARATAAFGLLNKSDIRDAVLAALRQARREADEAGQSQTSKDATK